MMQMSAMMRGAGLGSPPGGIGAATAFPVPGFPSGTAGTGATNPTLPSTPAQPGAAGTGAGLPNPALLQALLGGPGGGLGGLGGGLGPFGAPPTVPADTRTPEDRFQVQLQVRPTGSCIVIHLTSPSFLPATTRYGFRQCVSERPCPSCNWRQRARCDRVYLEWGRYLTGGYRHRTFFSVHIR